MKPKSNRELVLAYITEQTKQGNEVSVNQIAAAIGVSEQSTRAAVGKHQLDGLIYASGGTHHKRLYKAGGGPKPVADTTKTPARTYSPVMDRPPYLGEELGRNAGLPDSRFEAYVLPRREGERLYWPSGRVTRLRGGTA